MHLALGILLGFAFIFGLAYLADHSRSVRRFYSWLDDRLSANTFIVLCIVLGILIASFMKIPYVYSDGIKTGSITKFTQKGLIFKTWEGQLNLGGMVSDGDGGMVANVWNFSVQDPIIAEQLQSLQGRVSLKYDQHILVPIYEGSTNYIITDIKEQ